MIPVAGQMVVVRNRPGVVRDVVAYGGNGSGGALHLVELEYLDGWEHPGQEAVLWEREVAPRVVSRLALPDIADPASRPDAPDRFGAYLDAVRWSATARLIPRSEGVPWLLSPWQSTWAVASWRMWLGWTVPGSTRCPAALYSTGITARVAMCCRSKSTFPVSPHSLSRSRMAPRLPIRASCPKSAEKTR